MSVEIGRARRSDQSEVFRIVEQNHWKCCKPYLDD
jgi:hypothetical protein